MKDRVRDAFAQIKADDALVESTAAYLRTKREAMQKPKRLLLPRLARTFAVAAAILVTIFSYTLYFTADAYVSIDVNPSVELRLNRFDRVIGVYAFNEDGEVILESVSLWGKPYSQAAALLIAAMEEAGYFSGEALVSVTVQTAKSSKEQALCETLQSTVEDAVFATQAMASVEVYAVSEGLRSSAHGCNMSPAKYLAIQALMEVDETASFEAYGNCSIQQIRQRTQECRQQHGGDPDASGNGEGQGQGHGKGNGYGQHGRG